VSTIQYYEDSPPPQSVIDIIEGRGDTYELIPRPTSSSSGNGGQPPVQDGWLPTFLQNQTVTGPNGYSSNMNPIYFADPATAQRMAQQLGAELFYGDQFGSPGSPTSFPQQALLRLPNGQVVNAGLVANTYNHGYSQNTIDQILAGIINGYDQTPTGGVDPRLNPNAYTVTGGIANYNPTTRPSNVPPQIPAGPGGIPGWGTWDPVNETWKDMQGNPFQIDLSGVGGGTGWMPQTTGGNAPNTTAPQTYNPLATDSGLGNLFVTGQATQGSSQSGQGDQAFGGLFGDIGYLQGMVQGGGYSTFGSPTWNQITSPLMQANLNVNDPSQQLFNYNGNSQIGSPNWNTSMGPLNQFDPSMHGFLGGQDQGLLRNYAQTGGGSIDQLPAWNAMVEAQQRNIDRNMAQLEESMNASGNRFSTSFGNAANDYLTQTTRDQNAQLLAAQTQALEQMQGRRMTAAGQAGQLGLGAAQTAGQLGLGRAQSIGQLGVGAEEAARNRQLEALLGGGQLGLQYGLGQAGLNLQRGMGLAQMGLSAEEAARQREYGAASQLGQMGFQAGSQLTSQDFQSMMNQRAQALQAAIQMSQGSDYATQMLAQLGSGAANQLYGGSILGAQGLWGAENQAAQTMYGGGQQAMQQMLAYDQMLRQMGLGAAGNLSSLWQSNLGVGNQIAQGQYGTMQDQINRMYQEYLRTAPENNPMIPYMMSAATGYPPVLQSYQPGFWDYAAGIMGTIGGALTGRSW
jgi:hypothetical protein